MEVDSVNLLDKQTEFYPLKMKEKFIFSVFKMCFCIN